MSKTKIVVKDDQIMVDLEWIFDEIRENKGKWEMVEEQLMSLLDSIDKD